VRVVHDHVVSRGVDAVRLDTSTSLTVSYGRPRDVNPAERRVTIIVVLYAGRVPRLKGFEWRSIYGVL
jgi:hypothetical protein